ncbi:subtilisin DY-like [Condylostylus longicornis]|uniref:subtilisin DY-like n=1 Tax=Condylostylus longicornis TaxID=2530218 RepID=UPI00244DAF31|nr:subtilisin DY-like [Condylostylus longicornis]
MEREPCGDQRETRHDFPIVAIIDAGCDMKHPDLEGSLWRNSGETDCYDGIDNDGNGFIDDCYGWDFVDDAPVRHPTSVFNSTQGISAKSSLNHGTNLASLVGSLVDNAQGITGSCLGRCMVMCLRAVDQGESVDVDDEEPTKNGNDKSEERIVRALRYAYSMGARISTNSYGRKGKPFTELEKEIKRLSELDETGILFVAAAGNEGKNLSRNGEVSPSEDAFFPAAAASVGSVIVVGASNRDGQKLSFSNYGKEVSLFAPGILVAAATAGGGVDFVSGTSVSAPIVAGSAALIWSLLQELSLGQIKHSIVSSVTKSPHLTAYCQAGGVLNTWKAVQLGAEAQLMKHERQNLSAREEREKVVEAWKPEEEADEGAENQSNKDSA